MITEKGLKLGSSSLINSTTLRNSSDVTKILGPTINVTELEDWF